MGFATIAGLTVAETDERGLVAWGTGAYATLDSTPFNKTMQDNQNAAYYSLLSGVVAGGVCTGSVLTLSVPVGTIYFARQFWVASGTTSIVLPDNNTSYVWACSDGELRYTASASTFPTSFDGRSCCLLAKVTTLSGAITAIDLTVQQWARVLDPTGRMVIENNGGSYPLMDTIPAGATVRVPASTQQWYFDTLTIDGEMIIDGEVRIDE